MAQPIAKEGPIQIGAIKTGLQVVLAAVILDGCTGDAKERPNEAQRWVSKETAGCHATQSGKARATQEMHEHGFGLVVGVVTDGDGIRTDVVGYSCQESIACVTSRFFLAQLELGRQGADIDLVDGPRETPRFSQPADKARIGTGLGAAQSMIQVSDMEREIKLIKTAEDLEQTKGIWPARNPDDDGVAPAQQIVYLDSVSYRF
jgi:hypothetical protein